MTDSPPPSDRPETAQKAAPKAAFVLLRPLLFAIAAIGLTLGLLVLTHHQTQEALTHPAPPPRTKVAKQAGPPAEIAITDPEPPPPPTLTDFQSGFGGFQLKPGQAQADLEPTAPVSDRYELTLRLEKGDTVEKMLADIGVPEVDRKPLDEKLRALLKKQKLAVGEEIALELQTVPAQSDAPIVLSLSVRPQPEHEYIIRRHDDGSYTGEEKIYKVSPRIVRVEGTRSGSLQESGMAAGAPAQAMVEFIRALAYDVDFQRELKAGQHFTVLLEQLITSDGKITHPGRLLAGELVLQKRTVTVIRFRPQGGAEQFYNPKGESVVRSFLRTPMDVSKVTSGFGWRDHPILGFSAMHTGVDFGAQQGTPILAAGAGKVAMAGFNGGYGLFVKLEHTRDIGTGYGHMSRLGPGIKPGVSVRQGQVIGFVGSTGLSTGPHLHYEFYRSGHPVNPLAQKSAMQAALAGKDLQRYQALVAQYAKQLRNAPPITEAKAADAKPKDPPQVARGE
jgi:murein DD-endopeptidase MepM/ murein hydrolase activator NlpD